LAHLARLQPWDTHVPGRQDDGEGKEKPGAGKVLFDPEEP
jgi:hypothetical protein